MSGDLTCSVDFVRTVTRAQPKVGVILGSGLGSFANSLGQPVRIAYKDIPGFPVSTAAGHASELVIGSLDAHEGKSLQVAALSGRFHLYEGYTAREAANGVHLLHELGVQTVILTCAAGGLNPQFGEGALVLISDHINLQGANPLTGPNDERLGPRFPDMTEAYSAALRKLAHERAHALGITLYEGVYASLAGPSYETPAEIRFLKTIGADLVGMSVAAECIAANHMGMQVLGLACVTNLAAGLGAGKLVHTEVLEITRRVSSTFLRLLSGLIPEVALL